MVHLIPNICLLSPLRSAFPEVTTTHYLCVLEHIMQNITKRQHKYRKCYCFSSSSSSGKACVYWMRKSSSHVYVVCSKNPTHIHTYTEAKPPFYPYFCAITHNSYGAYSCVCWEITTTKAQQTLLLCVWRVGGVGSKWNERRIQECEWKAKKKIKGWAAHGK